MVFTGVPPAMSDWMLWVSEGFCPVALQMSGAKSVQVRKISERKEPDGRCTLVGEVSWQ